MPTKTGTLMIKKNMISAIGIEEKSDFIVSKIYQ